MPLHTAGQPARVVVVGASAGGVEALIALFSALPREVDAAFLVVLHIPAHGHSHLAEILARHSGMRVEPARNGEPIRSGHVYVARADCHLMAGDGTVRLTRGPRECRSRPSVDVLFRSAALSYGPRAIGVVLSGALDDGSIGLWAIKDAQGVALVQDPETAGFSSMPESALRHVMADLVGTVPALAAEIVRRTELPLAVQGRPADPRGRMALESRIASEGNAVQHGVLQFGKLSAYTCPECRGVLVQIEEGATVRFRCHTGHAFSIESLLGGLAESIDAGLWATLRALEERLLLLEQVHGLAQARGQGGQVEEWEQQAALMASRIAVLRELLVNVQPFASAILT